MKRSIKYAFIFVLMIVCCGLFALPAALSSYSNADSEQTVQISTLDQLQNAFTREDTTGVTFVLEDDFDLNGQDASFAYEFKGTFDGNGHTISNYKIVISNDNNYAGLFPVASGATIKNLKIDNIEVIIDSSNTNELYIGALVGYGENVEFENCELGKITIENNVQVASKIVLNTYANANIGVLAGKLKCDGVSEKININNCVNYFDVEANLNVNSSLNIGSIVGVLEQGKILNALSFGNIELKGSCEKEQNAGGIAGYVSGTNSRIKNACYGGEILANQIENVNVGALVGRVSALATPDVSNINFAYWTKDIASIGKGLNLTSDKIDRIQVINKDFLLDAQNFDVASPVWDFDHTWIMKNSIFHLQQFEAFEFKFANILDSTNVLDSQNTKMELLSDASQAISAYTHLSLKNIRYGEKVVISIVLKEEFAGFYALTNVILNSKNVDLQLPERDEYGNYQLVITADDSTAGGYSFVLNAEIFNCIIESANKAQGGVKTAEASTTVDLMNISFSYNSSTKKIVAVGKDVYTFDHWELFYLDKEVYNQATNVTQENFANGVYYTFDEVDGAYESTKTYYTFLNNSFSKVNITSFAPDVTYYTNTRATSYVGNKAYYILEADDELDEEIVSISFGREPYNKEFKLVAYFSTDKAVQIKFLNFSESKIQSLKLGLKEYNGEPIMVSPNATINFELVTKKGFVLNYEKLINDMQTIYGDNTIIMISDPIKDEETQTTTYKFNFYMKNVDQSQIEDKSMDINISIDQEKSSGSGLSVWVYVGIAAAVIAVAVAVVVIIFKKRGGARRGGSKGSKTSQKKTSYDDYYV